MEYELNLGVVVGATGSKLEQVRQIDESLIFLIPGVGAQGGSYQNAFEKGQNSQELALINVSRHILYAAADKQLVRQAVVKSIQSL